MAKDDLVNLLTGEILEKETELSLADLCRTCRMPAERIIELVQEGIIEPMERNHMRREPAQWRFRGVSIRRVRCAQHLEHDLGINVAGAALAIEMLEELERMRVRLHRLED